MELTSDDLSVISDDLNVVRDNIKDLRLVILLSGEYDKNGAYVEIHSGAGGTESNDWANMLYRMYLRYFDRKGYKYSIISESPGEIKNLLA